MNRLTIKTVRIIFAVVIFTAAAINSSAQDYVAPPVKISNDKVKIDGKVYYSHIVQERQTMYSIS